MPCSVSVPIRAVPYSCHSSFSSLAAFAEALSPQRIVLLEPLPVPCEACTTPGPPAEGEAGEPLPLGLPGATCSTRDGAHAVGPPRMPEGSSQQEMAVCWGPKDTPAALLLENQRVLQTFLAVREEAFGFRGASIISRDAAHAASPQINVVAGDGAASTEDTSGVSGCFNYDGREGLAAFIKATRAPTVVLGSGRRPFCPQGGRCNCQEGNTQKPRRRGPRGVSGLPHRKAETPTVPAVIREKREEGLLVAHKKVKRAGALLRFACSSGDP